jgi:hypothetical protein
MSMKCDYISGLLPPTAYCSSPKVIGLYNYGEPWWNNVDRVKLLIRPPERSLAILPAKLSNSKSKDLGEGIDGFCLRNISFTLEEFLYMP